MDDRFQDPDDFDIGFAHHVANGVVIAAAFLMMSLGFWGLSLIAPQQQIAEAPQAGHTDSEPL
jgi:hypothetical protein